MRSSTSIHDPRPVRENLPEGLGDFQRFSGIFEVKFPVATPLQGVATPLNKGRIGGPLTSDSLIKGS